MAWLVHHVVFPAALGPSTTTITDSACHGRRLSYEPAAMQTVLIRDALRCEHETPAAQTQTTRANCATRRVASTIRQQCPTTRRFVVVRSVGRRQVVSEVER